VYKLAANGEVLKNHTEKADCRSGPLGKDRGMSDRHRTVGPTEGGLPWGLPSLDEGCRVVLCGRKLSIPSCQGTTCQDALSKHQTKTNDIRE